MTSEEIQAYVFSFLKGKGLPDASSCAVMGNISQESTWDVTEIEAGTGIGFGLCQWSFERRTQLESYGTDLQHQCEFLWSELTGQNLSTTHASYQWMNRSGYLSNVNFMSGNGSINDLTASFCFCWERPNASEANLSFRQSEATRFYSIYNGTNPPTPTGDTIKLKNHTLWGVNDSLFKRTFRPATKDIKLISTYKDYSVISCGNVQYKVPTKNIIKS